MAVKMMVYICAVILMVAATVARSVDGRSVVTRLLTSYEREISPVKSGNKVEEVAKSITIGSQNQETYIEPTNKLPGSPDKLQVRKRRAEVDVITMFRRLQQMNMKQTFIAALLENMIRVGFAEVKDSTKLRGMAPSLWSELRAKGLMS